jgi:hypothetical protein
MARRQFRFQLRRDFIKKGLEPFTRHPFIVLEQWKEFMKQEQTEQASSVSVKFKKTLKLEHKSAQKTWVQLVIL